MTKKEILEMVFDELKDHEAANEAARRIHGKLLAAFPELADASGHLARRAFADGDEELALERAERASG